MKRYLWLAIIASVALWPICAMAQGAPGGETTPLRDMSDLALWSILGGAITSLVTAFLNKSHWRSEYKLAIFLVLCCVTAALNSYFNGDLNGATWLRSLMLVIVAGWTTYLAAKPAIKSIEAATS